MPTKLLINALKNLSSKTSAKPALVIPNTCRTRQLHSSLSCLKKLSLSERRAVGDRAGCRACSPSGQVGIPTDKLPAESSKNNLNPLSETRQRHLAVPPASCRDWNTDRYRLAHTRLTRPVDRVWYRWLPMKIARRTSKQRGLAFSWPPTKRRPRIRRPIPPGRGHHAARSPAPHRTQAPSLRTSSAPFHTEWSWHSVFAALTQQTITALRTAQLASEASTTPDRRCAQTPSSRKLAKSSSPHSCANPSEHHAPALQQHGNAISHAACGRSSPQP